MSHQSVMNKCSENREATESATDSAERDFANAWLWLTIDLCAGFGLNTDSKADSPICDEKSSEKRQTVTLKRWLSIDLHAGFGLSQSSLNADEKGWLTLTTSVKVESLVLNS